jgi:transposase
MVAYALRHGMQEIPHGSVQRRMEVHQPPSARARQRRTSQAPRPKGDPQDAVFFYVLKSGCPWRLLPREFPPWKTVYDWFRRWRLEKAPGSA